MPDNRHRNKYSIIRVKLTLSVYQKVIIIDLNLEDNLNLKEFESLEILYCSHILFNRVKIIKKHWVKEIVAKLNWDEQQEL
ncbi:hypothetical protein [endosymbiont GvMRE of Glomus versiforme]|uniref:hypothetical protein n=1 Tax=endosymbiont GvMRE of Glomus versiforme TaxID=2039283 RepID=UPI0011C42A91|nr:hypothetical protein [endosymbiont GvMRE of Glomus versiforme]